MQKIIYFFSLIYLLSGCVEKRDLSKNTIIAEISTTPDGLHPFNTPSSLRTYVYTFTQKSLHCTDVKTLKQIPILIEAMPDTVGDLTTFSFDLKKGITWDDGSALIGDDIVFTIKMTICPLTNNPGLKDIYSTVFEDVWVDEKNPLRVYYRTKSVHYTSKNIFQEIYIQQKKFWDSKGLTDKIPIKHIDKHEFSEKEKTWFKDFNGAENNFNVAFMNGLGAYKIKEFEQGSHISIVRKENHWTKGDTLMYNLSYPDKIVFKVISDKSALKLALKSERIDVTRQISAKTLKKLEKKEYFNENYFTDYKNRYVYYYMALNMKPDLSYQKPYFNDKRVRRAIAHLTPVDDIIDVLLKGNGSRQNTNTSSFNYRYNDTLETISLDINKAKKLLNEAGWEDTDGDHILDKAFNGKRIPFQFKVSYPSGGSSKDMVLMMMDEMKKAGVQVVPNPMDIAVFYKNAKNHDFDAMMGGWISGSGYSDPIQLWGVSNWANKGYNFSGFGNSRSDSLIEAANSTFDEAKHIHAYKAFQEQVYNDQPYVFLFSPIMGMAVHNRFDNIQTFMETPGIFLNSLILKDAYKKLK